MSRICSAPDVGMFAHDDIRSDDAVGTNIDTLQSSRLRNRLKQTQIIVFVSYLLDYSTTVNDSAEVNDGALVHASGAVYPPTSPRTQPKETGHRREVGG